MTATGTTGGAGDFDFLHGTWSVRHRKLRHRLKGDDAWLTFQGTMAARPILAGTGNFDENVVEDPTGAYEACTIRMFDPATGRWSIFWIDGRDPCPNPPVVGAFSNGVGLFLGHDTLDGRPILVRFEWSRTDGPSPRWEQAFSGDGGISWETNWIMEFDRMAGTEKEST